jgi:hypothetical protein
MPTKSFAVNQQRLGDNYFLYQISPRTGLLRLKNSVYNLAFNGLWIQGESKMLWARLLAYVNGTVNQELTIESSRNLAAEAWGLSTEQRIAGWSGSWRSNSCRKLRIPIQ